MPAHDDDDDADDDGMRIVWIVNDVRLPAWLPGCLPREIRNNPANRKSATSQVRCHKRHKELERNQSVVVLIAIYVAVAFAAQVVQIS